MNTPIIASTSVNVPAEFIGIDSTRRISKKQFFASCEAKALALGKPQPGKAEKQRAFAEYSDQFSQDLFAGVSSGVVAGKVRLTRAKLGKSGRTGSFGYEIVSDHPEKTGKLAAVQAELAAAKAELAKLKGEAAVTTVNV